MVHTITALPLMLLLLLLLPKGGPRIVFLEEGRRVSVY